MARNRAGQSYDRPGGCDRVEDEPGSLRWRMCGGDNPVMDSPSGWSTNPGSPATVVEAHGAIATAKTRLMEGTRLEEPVLPFASLEDADYYDEG